jgi:hypothetical protein
MTLVAINRLSGRADWSTGISDRPLRNPADQIVESGECAYCACQGMLRRISLSTGRRDWERFLGNAAEQWRIAAQNDVVAGWPITGTDSAAAKGLNPAFVVWCDANDGRILRRLTLPSGDLVVEVAGDGQGWLVQTKRSLIAYRPVDANADTATVANR